VITFRGWKTDMREATTYIGDANRNKASFCCTALCEGSMSNQGMVIT